MPVSDSALDRAAQWFVRSGIQEPEGGVARYYRSDTGRNATVSTEITGYAVSFLTWAYRETGRAELLDGALRSAWFLRRHAWNPALGLFPFEHSFNGSQPAALAYFFDSGIIVRGLLAIWSLTREQEFLEVAVDAGRGMQAHFRASGGLHPILALPERRALGYAPRWSASPGCYQLKAAMAWRDLFEATGDDSFGLAYLDSLNEALQTHTAFLPGDPDREKVMDRLHAYLYFLEGALPGADQPEVRDAIRRGIHVTGEYSRAIAHAFVRSDVFAQLLRVRLYAEQAGGTPLDHGAAAWEAEQLAQFQFAAGGPRVEGGYGFGLKAGRPLPFVNPVSTAFCAQALTLWGKRGIGPISTDRLALV